MTVVELLADCAHRSVQTWRSCPCVGVRRTGWGEAEAVPREAEAVIEVVGLEGGVGLGEGVELGGLDAASRSVLVLVLRVTRC